MTQIHIATHAHYIATYVAIAIRSYLISLFYKMYTVKYTQLATEDQHFSSNNHSICCDIIVFSSVTVRRWRQCVKHGIVKLK